MKYEITNVCCSAKLQGGYDLKYVGFFFEKVKYNPRTFNQASIKLDKATVNLFKNGKANIVGGKSIEDCQQTMEQVASELEIDITDFKVTNMVGSSALDFKIDLASLYTNISQPSWEPEVFPGLRFRLLGVSLVVFSSGKFNILGATNKQQIEEAVDKFTQIAQDHALDQGTVVPTQS